VIFSGRRFLAVGDFGGRRNLATTRSTSCPKNVLPGSPTPSKSLTIELDETNMSIYQLHASAPAGCVDPAPNAANAGDRDVLR
jgi:hypothetical protein